MENTQNKEFKDPIQQREQRRKFMVKPPFPSGDVPDLLSFDSWEYSALTEGISTATSTTNEECSLVTSPSMDTATGGDAPTPLTSSQKQGSTIHLLVSGVIFSLNSCVFKRLEKLPWQLPVDDEFATSFVTMSGAKVHPLLHLHTSPVLFEKLLNFLMYGNFPVLSEISLSDVEELELLAALLDLHDLQQHLAKKNRVPFRRASGSFHRRQSAQRQIGSSNTKQLGVVEKVMKHGTSSDTIKGGKRPGPVRVMQAALTNRRLTSQRTDTTHEELCVSSESVH
jgi:hypothetical protein